MYEEREAWAPIIVFEHDHNPGNYSLMLTDSHFVKYEPLFQAAGHEGTGYDWVAVALQSVRAYKPELDGRFDVDPEAGMFVAYGDDLEALQGLAALMRAALSDEERLKAVIAAAEPGWFD